MSRRRVTVSIDAGHADAIRALVDAGRVRSVSAFLDHAAAVALEDDAWLPARAPQRAPERDQPLMEVADVDAAIAWLRADVATPGRDAQDQEHP